MQLLDSTITGKQLRDVAADRFGNMVKAVVDIAKRIMVIDADLHADEEAFLLSRGSNQADLWGINLYPDLTGDDFIEFDSMINLRPHQNNRTRGVDDEDTRKKIQEIVASLII